MSNEIENMKSTLKTLESNLDRRYKDLDTLDGKARANIQAASLLLGLISAFQLLAFKSNISLAYGLLLGGVLISFWQMIRVSIKVMNPTKYYIPLPADWDVVEEYWHIEESERLRKEISDCIEAIERNSTVVTVKSEHLENSNIYFGITIGLLIFAAYLRLFI